MKIHIIEKLNHLSLKAKLFISFIFFLIIPFFLISSVIVNQTRLIMTISSYQQADENMSRSKKLIMESLERILTVSDFISLDDNLETLVNTQYPNVKELFLAYHDFTQFEDFINLTQNIKKIRFYFDNPTLLDNSEIIPLDGSSQYTPWYSYAKIGGGSVFWGEINTGIVSKEFGISRMVTFKEFKSKGVLTISLDTDKLCEILAQESFDTFLLDEAGDIIASSNFSLEGGRYAAYLDNNSLTNTPPGSYEITINGISYRLLVDTLEMRNSRNSLILISFFSIPELLKDANSLWKLFFRLLALNIGLAFASLYGVYHFFVERLLKVGRQMDKLAQGNFNSMLTVDGTDEIGQLAVRYNNMVSNIQKLMTEINETNEQKRLVEKRQNEIKIKMLASQINPHFLFNALESIRMKAHMENQKEIANTVKQLGKLMRSVLAVEGSSIELEDELKIIESFLAIERFRLGNELDYKLEIEPECRKIKFPPLLLQPLVENAVIHGIEKNTEPGIIYIKAFVSKGFMTVRISDNGPGLPTEKISRILSGEYRSKGNHIGLFNVNQRLVLNYGKESGLDIENKTGGGLTISFNIPLETENV